MGDILGLIFGVILLALLLAGPLVLIVCVFILARRLEKRDAATGRLLFTSWLVGVLGLLPGLAIVTHHEYGGCFFICLETATETLGWPLSWLGYNGLGNLYVPLYILGDVMIVALVYLTLYVLAGSVLTFLMKREPGDSTLRTAAVSLAFVAALFPFWGGMLFGRTVLNASTYAQPNEEQVLGPIHLQCTEIRIIQSPKYPGIKALEVVALAQTPGNYEIHAYLQDTYGNRIADTNENIHDLHAHRGNETNHLYFLFHPVDHSTLLPAVKSNGPYTILFYNANNDEKPIDECSTPPFSLINFVFPTPGPTRIPPRIGPPVCLKWGDRDSCWQP